MQLPMLLEVPKIVRIRDLTTASGSAALRAAEWGASVPEMLRGEATRLAARPTTSGDLGLKLVVDASCLYEVVEGIHPVTGLTMASILSTSKPAVLRSRS